MVELLLEKGCDVKDAGAEDGNTALHLACQVRAGRG